MSNILFFPMSMPDETLQSRITRYHSLSGNKSESDTFKDLFGTAPFAFTIIPKQIDNLAARLPGENGANLNELLDTNSIFPVYRPFVGILREATKDIYDNKASAVARIPRREVSTHSMAKICISCIGADLIETGYSYWHRAHHIPGITACWRHGEALIQSCPNCSHPFYRKLKLLPDLTAGCICGWRPLSGSTQQISDTEWKFAIFAKDLLDRNLPAIDCEVLAACYRRQAKKLGFRHGQFVSTKKLFDSIQSKFGDELLSKIDRAFAAGKHHQWIRTTTVQGQLDMPISRHLIICYHLFGKVDQFEECLANESLLFKAAPVSPPQKTKNTPTNRKKLYREKVSQLIEARPDLNLDYLWANAYQVTLWLVTNDKLWLSEKLAAGAHPRTKKESQPDKRDQQYANIIREGVDALYRISKKQVRVNLSNMLALLPTPVRLAPDARTAAFPLVSQQLELHFESLWHFRLRRAIFALSEMARLKLAPNGNSVRLVSTVPWTAWLAITNHFEWDFDNLISEGVNAELQLSRANVSRQWEGPPGRHASMGGRSYVPVHETAQR